MLKKYLFLLAALLLSHAVYAEDAEVDEWIDMSTENDFIEPAAAVLAKRLVPKLRAEKISVVNINLETCAADSYWCKEFEKDFAEQLSKRNIFYTHTSSASEDKDSVSSELAFQQNSMQVSRERRVRMGRQKAVQAILKLSVYKTDAERKALDKETGIYNVNVRSLNLEKGVYTSSSSVKVKIYRAETTDYSAVVKTGFTGVLGLGFIAAAGYYGYQSYNQYMDYDDQIRGLDESSFASDELYKEDKKKLERKRTEAAIIGSAAVIGGAILGNLSLGFASDYYKQISGYQDHYLIREGYADYGKNKFHNLSLMPHIQGSEYGLTFKFEY